MRVKIFSTWNHLIKINLVYPWHCGGNYGNSIEKSEVSNTFVQIVSIVVWIAGNSWCWYWHEYFIRSTIYDVIFTISCKTKLTILKQKELSSYLMQHWWEMVSFYP
jgi:hypothetical protein